MVRTDHQSLKCLLEQRVGTPGQQKWINKLMGYAFAVEYKKGVENKMADALSRKEDLEQENISDSKFSMLFFISFPNPTWIDILKDIYQQDPELQSLIQAVQSDSATSTGFSMQNGLLLFKGRFYLGSNSPLKHLILHHVHASPMADHSGFLKSLHRAKREFFWKGMKSDIK